jgi:BRCA1-associated protein
LQADLEEEKELNKCLSSNQEVYQKKLAQLEETFKKSSLEKEGEIKELQSQLRDVMFYLDAQSKIGDLKDQVSNEEIQNSQMLVVQDEATGTSNNNRRRKKK